MQNKPNLKRAKKNANVFITTDYENISDWTLGENKPNSNPIKPNFTYPQRHALSRACPELAVALSVVEGVVEWAEGGKTEVRCRMSEVIYLPSVFCLLSMATSIKAKNKQKNLLRCYWRKSLVSDMVLYIESR